MDPLKTLLLKNLHIIASLSWSDAQITAMVKNIAQDTRVATDNLVCTTKPIPCKDVVPANSLRIESSPIFANGLN